jgi:hypothetical protein
MGWQDGQDKKKNPAYPAIRYFFVFLPCIRSVYEYLVLSASVVYFASVIYSLVPGAGMLHFASKAFRSISIS